MRKLFQFISMAVDAVTRPFVGILSNEPQSRTDFAKKQRKERKRKRLQRRRARRINIKRGCL